MRLYKLDISDLQALLRFESANRAWFEHFIEAREPHFYHPEGLQQHIEECLLQSAEGSFYPGLIKSDTGEIIGRINLRNIDSVRGEAVMGYRVAESAVGRGVATNAVRQLLEFACTELGLSSVRSFVSVENPASAKVLQKCGFARGLLHPGMAMVRGRVLDCYEYHWVAGDGDTLN